MGLGNFTNGKFNFTIAAPQGWGSPTEKSEWMARFIEASQALHEATEGQMSFGDIFMADEGWGLGQAEFVLHAFESTAYATHGDYGQPGRAIQLFSQQRTGNPTTIVHEFGHHAFGLGDEYTGPVGVDEIDTEAPIPDNGTLFQVVPLIASELDSQSLANGFAVVQFGGRIERMIVNQHTPTGVTVYGTFSQDPRTADNGRIFYQPQYNYTHPEFPDGIVISCRGPGVQNPNYCLMERYNVQGASPVSEFCSPGNHDPDHDTSHDALHNGLSCWEVIQQTMQEKHGFPLTMPDPAQTGNTTTETPFFHDLVKEARLALVLDRSGSMGDDNKIQGARFGVEQWITAAHEAQDWMSVVWFNGTAETNLDLTQVPASQIEAVIGDATSPDPGGWTNIRDGLFRAADQIQSRDGRAAIQAIVLLTDGIHNRPLDTTAQEAIPTLKAAGIPVHAIALGTPENVDYGTLEEIVQETGGTMLYVGLVEGADGNLLPPEQHNALIAFYIFLTNDLLRNGSVQVGGEDVAGAPPGSAFAKAIEAAKGERLPLEKLAKILRLKSAKDLIRRRRNAYTFAVPFHVEEGADVARFAITFARMQRFHLHLVDPSGKAVDFQGDGNAVLIAPESPYATAIVRKPKPGLWHAVIVRASAGATTRVFFSAGVENRMITVAADCAREVAVGQPVAISASAGWGDMLTGLRVTARITAPNGSTHHVVLNDEQADEPGSGDYKGVFTPSGHGRYSGLVSIVGNGRLQHAGSLHRATHAPRKKEEPHVEDLRSKAPAFVRRIPIYFDAGLRPTPKDLDRPRSGHKPVAPVRERKKPLRPLKIDAALKLVAGGKQAKPKRPTAAHLCKK